MMNSSQDLGVRVIVAYENKCVGRIIFPPGLLRDKLIKCGLVERVEAPEKPARKILKSIVGRG